MEIRNILEIMAFSKEKMKKVGLFSTSRFFCDLYCFEPGQEQKPHVHHGEDKVYFVLEGEGTFRIGDEVKNLSQNMVTLAPSGIEHGVRNEGTNRLVLFVFMSPNSHFQKGEEGKGHGHTH